ncbi:MAG: 3D domain-containing protein [Clostridia bacterium]|nr:3D domain-containing protein [Clostridia bacterium]
MRAAAWIAAILAALLSLFAVKIYRDGKMPLDIDEKTSYEYTTKKDLIEYFMITTEPERESAVETEISESETEPESMKTEEISTTQEQTGTERQKTTKAATTASTETTVKSASGEKYRITVYVPDEEWGYQTSTGVTSRHLQTCAVDPNVIPLGSTVVVYGDNGQVLELFACDIGGGVKGKHIDVFYDGTEAEAYDWLFRFGEYQVVEIK